MPSSQCSSCDDSSSLLPLVLFLGSISLHQLIDCRRELERKKNDEALNQSNRDEFKIKGDILGLPRNLEREDMKLYTWNRNRNRLSFDAEDRHGTQNFQVGRKDRNGRKTKGHHHFERSLSSPSLQEKRPESNKSEHRDSTSRGDDGSSIGNADSSDRANLDLEVTKPAKLTAHEKVVKKASDGAKANIHMLTYSQLVQSNNERGRQMMGTMPTDNCKSVHAGVDALEKGVRRRSRLQKFLDHINSSNSSINSTSTDDREGDETDMNDEETTEFDAASIYATERILHSFNDSADGNDMDNEGIDNTLLQPSTFAPTPNLVIKPPQQSFQRARSDYNSRIMPNRVIMVRHGQSEGNVNEHLYTNKPDNLIQLTKLGWHQARMSGKALRNQILERTCRGRTTNNGIDNAIDKNQIESVHFIVSPYVRTMETFHGLVSAWCDPDKEFGHIEDLEVRKMLWYDRLAEMGITWHEDPRIREQDFGNYQDPTLIRKAKSERHKFGVFYYRFPNGEAASDVYERVSTFLDSLWRSFDVKRSNNYVLVTHGISIRVLLARYFRYSIDQFNMLANPRNGEMILLAHDGCGKLQLEGRCELDVKETKNNTHDQGISDEMKVTGFNFYRKLRIVPKHHMRCRNIRLSDKA